jgi:hypothetical protein
VKGLSVRKVVHGRAHGRLRHEFQERPRQGSEGQGRDSSTSNKGPVLKERQSLEAIPK